MRKRKSPIALVSILVVIASVAFGFNYASSKTASPDAPPPAAPPVEGGKTLGAPRPGADAKGVSSAIKSSIGAEPDPKMQAHGGPPGMGGPGGPAVMNPMHAMGKPEKPKPNTSSTSAQWYDKESGMGGKD